MNNFSLSDFSSPIADQPKEKPKPSPVDDEDNSSDEEFDVAWERRAKQKARKEAANAPPPPPTPPVESPPKRTVRFLTPTTEPSDLIELDLDLDETAQDGLSHSKDQNNTNGRQHTEVVQLDDDDDDDTIVSLLTDKTD